MKNDKNKKFFCIFIFGSKFDYYEIFLMLNVKKARHVISRAVAPRTTLRSKYFYTALIFGGIESSFLPSRTSGTSTGKLMHFFSTFAGLRASVSREGEKNKIGPRYLSLPLPPSFLPPRGSICRGLR